MTVRSLDHVYAESRKWDEARAFWAALGFAAESEWGEDGHRACSLVSGTARVVLAETAPGPEPARPTVHLRVADADAAMQIGRAHV